MVVLISLARCQILSQVNVATAITGHGRVPVVDLQVEEAVALAGYRGGIRGVGGLLVTPPCRSWRQSSLP